MSTSTSTYTYTALHSKREHSTAAVSPAYVVEDSATSTATATATGTATSSNSNTSVPSPIYVSATRQHVGKTSTAMALLSGLQKRFDQVGFMKPVGQQSLRVQTRAGDWIDIDKDAVLVKEHFGFDHLDYKDTSPVLIPKGYTRDYLDGKISYSDQESLVRQAYTNIMNKSDVLLCEGTGHCAVGSIVHASNAQVASWLNAKMVLVANGGLGKCFDELQLNKILCDHEQVEVAGVIINMVQPDKLDQTKEYIQKALNLHWGSEIPLLGCIPDRPFLGCPALTDLEGLFGTQLLTGRKHRLRHYRVQDLNLVATSLQVFLRTLRTNPSRTLYVCHASRNDILLGFLMAHPYTQQRQQQRSSSSSSFSEAAGEAGSHQAAMIVTGTDKYPLSEQVLELIKGMNGKEHSDEAPPVLLAPHPTVTVMDKIHRFTPKLNYEDASRANTAVNHYEPHIDFDLLLERTGYTTNNDDTDTLVTRRSSA